MAGPGWGRHTGAGRLQIDYETSFVGRLLYVLRVKFQGVKACFRKRSKELPGYT